MFPQCAQKIENMLGTFQMFLVEQDVGKSCEHHRLHFRCSQNVSGGYNEGKCYGYISDVLKMYLVDKQGIKLATD